MERMLPATDQTVRIKNGATRLHSGVEVGGDRPKSLVIPFLIPPWQHQLKAIQHGWDSDCLGLFFEMGTGKTATTINILRGKYMKHKQVLRTLILCPPIVIQNWRREFKAHSKVGDKVICLEGTGKKRVETIKKYWPTSIVAPGNIFVTNYESLLMKPVFDLLREWRPEAIVFDESHKLKNKAARRTKLAIQIADQAKYRYILTGTPVLNTPMDLFSQFRCLDGGYTFGRNFFVFRATYFEDKNAGMPKDKYFPNWVIRKGALEEFHRKIQPLSMSVKKEECLDLPPLVRQKVFVELTKDQQKYYDAMKKDFIAFVEGKACVAELAITKALRLQQIVSGFVKVEDGANVSIKQNPRAAALRDLLTDICPEHKCLVWCVFRENYAAVRKVCDELKIPYVEVHGEVSPSARQKAVDSFQTDPAVRVFIGHPGSGGVGINLVAASYSIYYSRGFSLENDLQSEARNHRGGSEIHEKITRIDLVAGGTIDEIVLEKLAAKVVIGEKILRNIAQELK